jgi:small subunit ribosomal protein S4
MGDPRQIRKKYATPSHPWQKLRIEEEAVLMKEYGFKNKTELWKLNSKLNNIKSQVKDLIPRKDKTAEQQKLDLIARLQKLGLLKETAILEDILAINLKDLCERRLQTLVFKKELAHSVKQARQFIVHEHVFVGDKKITSPSFIVNAQQETTIKFADNSPLFSEDHPERVQLEKEVKEEMEEAHVEKKEQQKTKKSAKEDLKEDIGQEKAELAKEEEEEQ